MRALLTAATLIALAAPAAAQEFTIRGGVDVRPLVGYNSNTGNGITIADVGWLGIHVVPGLKVAKIFTIELGLEPLIPITGDIKPNFAFLVSPGIYVDLQFVYARAAIPISIEENPGIFLEGAVGLSFLGHGYLGVLVDYSTSSQFMMVGAEVGYKF